MLGASLRVTSGCPWGRPMTGLATEELVLGAFPCCVLPDPSEALSPCTLCDQPYRQPSTLGSLISPTPTACSGPQPPQGSHLSFLGVMGRTPLSEASQEYFHL